MLFRCPHYTFFCQCVSVCVTAGPISQVDVKVLCEITSMCESSLRTRGHVHSRTHLQTDTHIYTQMHPHAAHQDKECAFVCRYHISAPPSSRSYKTPVVTVIPWGLLTSTRGDNSQPGQDRHRHYQPHHLHRHWSLQTAPSNKHGSLREIHGDDALQAEEMSR